ncbi:SHOCT domain-containing protein [Halorussus limi]|uniref:SHOCT domain-containing protein n=1 Tax=Halorussus limi TaxID=2938695 RepID=A0A8U0HRN8_9EURY|nr:SHOCT domain-containing protein [Halorussus limi]UPV73396.1 SHOCT domain-containing protein [Halorussus limi]
MNQSADTSTFRALHRLVEHYTPDGTLGRSLLGVTALVCSPFLFFGGVMGLETAANFAAFGMALFASVLGVPAFFVGLLTLWPVYLSLIGNVESPELYPDGASEPAASEDRESAEAILKRRYAAGELSREEFERQLDAVMGDSRSDRGTRPTGEERRTGEEKRSADRRERTRSR